MYYYKTIIRYEGTKYAGFQWQTGIQTIQNSFNKAITKLIDGKFTTTGASRTDSGVHAVEQVVKISSENPIDLSSFLLKFNSALPLDIQCLEIAPCAGLFRPAAFAITKEYRYFFTNKKQVSIEERQYIANISNNLILLQMKICVEALVGEHDFRNFYSRGSNVKSTIRNISICEISVINPHHVFIGLELFQIPKSLNSCYQLRIVANGFLKQMIRHVISALWMVGSGKISTDDFLKLLDGPKSEKTMWKVAAPNGLFLYRVNYSDFLI